ncbi:hypothetical protein MKW94_003209 [Papaver nudicaule]|uniref:MAR-binding filament-like protein 1-1 n=1 Tax=Papaver nudicaule TaxID=74823 RepID=A0AA41RT84_PAPNU|nr:hypothetical protein [Papaver nudicaule]
MGSSNLLQSSLTHQSLLLNPSSSCFNSQPLFISSQIQKNVKKPRLVTMATIQNPNESNNNLSKRRTVLLLGISALPFLQLKAKADDAAEEAGDIVPVEDQNVEELNQGEASTNSFLSLLNAAGVVGTGVLGALNLLGQQEKTATEATIKKLENKLIEKEALKDTLEKNFEKKLLNEKEERANQMKKAEEERFSLSSQLSSAKSTISGLQKELQTEKKLVAELQVQIDRLQDGLKKAAEEKNLLEKNLKEKLDTIDGLQDRINLITLEINEKQTHLQKLESALADKETEYKDLGFVYIQAKADLAEANAKIAVLNETILKTQKELDLKNSTVNDLDAKLTALVGEKDDISRRFESVQEDYQNLKISSEKKAALDAEVLAKRENELNQLEEKLGAALQDVSNKEILVADLTQEKDNLAKMLKLEVKLVETLRNELRATEETLRISKVEASHLSEILQQSQKSCEDLSSEISKKQVEFDEASKALKKNLEDARSNSEFLSNELGSVKTALKKTKEESRTVSEELKSVIETREELKKELIDAYKKAESTVRSLEAERNTISSLRKELETSEKQAASARESRKSLETDLEKATKALEEVNKNILILSKELDDANSRVSNLEVDKETLYKALMEQKNISGEARENVEDAHNLIMRLGQERESLEKRVKKLDDELGSAKGEILRLRDQMNTPKILSENGKENKTTEGKATVAVKKTTRRKKADPLSETSK